jgi:hypothetical protein
VWYTLPFSHSETFTEDYQRETEREKKDMTDRVKISQYVKLKKDNRRVSEEIQMSEEACKCYQKTDRLSSSTGWPCVGGP